jgi:Ni/Co efflux regulator RcnB
MTSFRKVLALMAISTTLASGMAFAQDRDHHDDHHDDHGYVRHQEWHKGAKISHDDWNRAQPVDYHQHHLNAPPRGYEWRQVDGNYVLAAAATGIIASAIIASSVH